MNNQKQQRITAWEKVTGEKKVWDYLTIENSAFHFQKEKDKVFLSSFKTKDLPQSPYELTFMGKVLTKMSVFANIMSRRPGTEEVTFYSLLNRPQRTLFGDGADKKILGVVAPPITWRRIEIENQIQAVLREYAIERQESFAFVDIGCGGGFDSLEIERILFGLQEELGEEILPGGYDILNLDIDTKWLQNNERLSKLMFGEKSNIRRKNVSIFDYLKEQTYTEEFKNYPNLLVSCNGFAEFLSDEDLRTLYEGIYAMAKTFDGRVDILLPFANKNPQQEALGNKIGFKFRAKEKEFMIQLTKEVFRDFEVTFSEKYSQIVLIAKKM